MGWEDLGGVDYNIYRDNFSIEDREEYRNAVIMIILKQPWPYFHSRYMAFKYLAATSNNYNLYMPLVISVIICFYFLKEKNIPMIAFWMGMLFHVMLTILLMPASYFKYFFEMWISSYVFIIVVVIELYGLVTSKV